MKKLPAILCLLLGILMLFLSYRERTLPTYYEGKHADIVILLLVPTAEAFALAIVLLCKKRILAILITILEAGRFLIIDMLAGFIMASNGFMYDPTDSFISVFAGNYGFLHILLLCLAILAIRAIPKEKEKQVHA